MSQKIDKRLQEAVQKGFKKKAKALQKSANDASAKQKAHEKELKKYLPKARAWVKDKLFNLITKEEASGHSHLSLPEYTDGIPTEVIFNLVKKIKGLDITWSEQVLWEDSDYGKVKGIVYTVTWKSADPNLNRNDR